MASKKAKPKAEQNPAKQPAEPDTTGKTIDERMDALLEDHKKMGAR